MGKQVDLKVDTYDYANSLFKVIQKHEILTLKQKYIRWKYLLLLKKVDRISNNISPQEEYAIYTQYILNTTNINNIYARYLKALEENDVYEVDYCFDLLVIETKRLKDTSRKLNRYITLLTKDEAKVIIEKYKEDEVTEEDLGYYPKTKSKILEFPNEKISNFVPNENEHNQYDSYNCY